MLNLIPPLFAGGIFFDNSYYTILYLLLAYTSVILPYLVEDLPKILKIISTMLGGWFISGLIMELINIVTPNIIINNSIDKVYFLKIMITFTIGITFSIINSIWSKVKR